ncbi:MAG: prohibitin family protein [Armatimonadetes bacterium]|nr:prohibitin family protein [Armatimonadota bacterium]
MSDTSSESRRVLWTGAMIVVAVFTLLFLKSSLVIVGAGQRGVIFNIGSGVQQVSLREGLHFVMPFVQRVTFYDVRSQTYTMSAIHWEGEVRGDDSLASLTADGQTVKLDISVRFRPVPEEVWKLHQKVGRDYIAKIIRPELRSLTRLTVSEYPVTDVYTNRRQDIENRMEEKLRRSMATNSIAVDELLLRNVEFSPAYHDAIQQKQIAQQDAERMRYVLERARLEKQQKVIEAEGEARALRLKANALAVNQKLIQYEYARKIAPNVRAIITDGKSLGSAVFGK